MKAARVPTIGRDVTFLSSGVLGHRPWRSAGGEVATGARSGQFRNTVREDMKDDRWVPYGAAAGAISVAFFVTGALIVGERPPFDAPATDVASHLAEARTRIQVGCAFFALFAPFFV